jgi:hypothetical protein
MGNMIEALHAERGQVRAAPAGQPEEYLLHLLSPVPGSVRARS